MYRIACCCSRLILPRFRSSSHSKQSADGTPDVTFALSKHQDTLLRGEVLFMKEAHISPAIRARARSKRRSIEVSGCVSTSISPQRLRLVWWLRTSSRICEYAEPPPRGHVLETVQFDAITELCHTCAH